MKGGAAFLRARFAAAVRAVTNRDPEAGFDAGLHEWEESGIACKAAEPEGPIHDHGERVLRHTLRWRRTLIRGRDGMPEHQIRAWASVEFGEILRDIAHDFATTMLVVDDHAHAEVGRRVSHSRPDLDSTVADSIRRELQAARAEGRQVNMADLARAHGVTRQHVSKLKKQIRSD